MRWYWISLFLAGLGASCIPYPGDDDEDFLDGGPDGGQDSGITDSGSSMGDGAAGDAATDPTSCATDSLFFDVATGESHACAIRTSDNRLFCWGHPLRVGSDVSTVGPVGPTPVAPSLQFAEVDAAGNHTCAVTTDGRLFCWGSNVQGQLGVPLATESSLEPVQEQLEATDWEFIAVGGSRTCGTRKSDSLNANPPWAGGYGEGYLYCMGNVPLCPTEPGVAETPTPMATQYNATVYSWMSMSTWHTCAITVDGDLHCWGSNSSGQLGVDSTATPSSDCPVDLEVKWLAVATSESRTCAERKNTPSTGLDSVYCWGLGPDYSRGAANPINISNGLDTTYLAIGVAHECTLVGPIEPGFGRPHCRGEGDFGQLGLGNTDDAESFTPVVGIGAEHGLALDVGEYFGCAITSAGSLYCWGENYEGQLGTGDRVPRYSPTLVCID